MKNEAERHFVQKVGQWGGGKYENLSRLDMKQRNFIGWLVRRKRDQNAWTQDVFADKLQLAGWYNATRSTVSKIEDGSLRIDLMQVYYIAEALRIGPNDFLSEIDWRKLVEKMICFPKQHPKPVKPYGNHPSK